MASSSAVLTAKMDALADALRAARVDPERITRILGSAAEATMHALVLDAMLDEQTAASTPSTDEAHPHVRPVRLAA